MEKKRFFAAAVSVIALTLAGALLPASPASARPKDCSLSVKFSRDLGGLYARADVRCKNKEDYRVRIFIRRKDGISWTPVEDKGKNINKKGYGYISATEPCRNVSTKKTYKAHAKLYDSRFPFKEIQVKEVFSGQVKGHC